MPKKPLKEGERKGEVKIEIDDYDIIFNFTAKNQKPKLHVFDKSGRPQKAPATLFKKLFGVVDFEIDKFLNLSTKNQVDFLKNLLGIDWTEVDNKYKNLFEERTYLNRQIKEFDAKLEGKRFDPNLKKIDIEAIQKELEEANTKNVTHSNVENGIKTRRTRLEEIQRDIEELISIKDATQKQILDGERWLESNEKVDTTEISASLNKAIENNGLITENEQSREDREKAAELVNTVDAIEHEMNEIKELKKKELETAKMPVEGLSFDDDSLYLDGHPFNSDQINTARKIIAGLQIQYACSDSQVKIARFDGSLLDKHSMKIVEAWAKEKGIQLFVELVDREGDTLKIEVAES